MKLTKWLTMAAAASPFMAAGMAGAREVVRADSARRRGITVRDGVPVPEPSVGLGMAAAVDALLATTADSPSTHRKSTACRSRTRASRR